ncbi:hypothetical protein [uncultured Abyssibacter sp.]|uniref:hypothetical protein n=1 Tax=uncultured Abyssibacter sp. TaxID=2320202 RepID=UPI0032B1322F|tara:strand:- start:90 stop:410 length:321 start_codon:yes stop_codon:yes gene_type:complete
MHHKPEQTNHRSLQVALAMLACIAPMAAAQAYVGPGAGLSLLGALWGLIAALGAAVLFVLLWPIRRARRRRRLAAQAEQAEAMDETPDEPAADVRQPQGPESGRTA